MIEALKGVQNSAYRSTLFLYIMGYLFTILAALFSFAGTVDMVRYEAADREIAVTILSEGQQSVDEIAVKLLGTKYVSGSLEQQPEQLSVSLTETDCILFVEVCLALALESVESAPSFEGFCRFLKNLRYRNGVVDGYTSRIHYTSEWIAQAQSNGYLEEVTSYSGGIERTNTINYMSTHPDLYPMLVNDAGAVSEIARIEMSISEGNVFFIPESEIKSHLSEIMDGDLIFFTTTVSGLDIAHAGIAFHKDGILTFIHASSSSGEVIINEKPLVDYTNGIRSFDGIRVARVNR